MHKKDTACKPLGLTSNSFFMVIPFVKYVTSPPYLFNKKSKCIVSFVHDVWILDRHVNIPPQM